MATDTIRDEPSAGAPAARANATIGYVLMLCGAALFGINASVSKVALGAGIEPARLAALRCTGAGIGLFVVLGVARPARLRVRWRELPALAILGLTGAALIQWFYFVAIDRLPVGIALLLEFTGPLLVALFATVVLRERVSRHVWLALALSLSGLALVTEVWTDVGLDPIGVAAGFGAAACLATFYLLGQHTLQGRDPITVTFWVFLFASIFWAVVQPWWTFDPAVLTQDVSMLGNVDTLTVPVWLPLAWVVVLGTLVPYALALGALRRLPPATTGTVGMMEPVVAAVVAWVWLGQALTPVQVLGGSIVLIGVTIVQARRRAAVLASPLEPLP